ncbi:hypothetical protein Ahia01_000924100 [Argonauta hians]
MKANLGLEKNTANQKVSDLKSVRAPEKMLTVIKMSKPKSKKKPLKKYRVFKSVIIKTISKLPLKNHTEHENQTNSVNVSSSSFNGEEVNRLPMHTSSLFTRILHNLFGGISENASSKSENGIGIRLVRMYPLVMKGPRRVFTGQRSYGNLTNKNNTMLKIVLISNEKPMENNVFRPFFDMFRSMSRSIRSFFHSMR